MKGLKPENISETATSGGNGEISPEIVRREFLKRFGVYAAGSAVGLYVLMSPKRARAIGSDGAP